MTSEVHPDPDLDPDSSFNYSRFQIPHDSEPLMNLRVAMLFPSDGIDNQTESPYKKLYDIQQRYPAFVESQVVLKTSRLPMGGKRAPRIPDEDEDRARKSKKSKEAELFQVPGLVATLDDLPRTPYISEISNRTAEAVLAGTMLVYIHLLSSNTFKTASGRTASGSENIAAFLCERHNLGRPRRAPGRPRLSEELNYPTIDEVLAKRSWKKFQSVCHLWAAYVHVLGFQRDLTVVRLTDDIDWQRVLVLATQYEAIAENFFAPRTVVEKHMALVPVLSLGFSDWVFDSKQWAVAEEPDGVLDAIRSWVSKYDTKHK